jgi:AcrR family transcriptional regulator
MYRVFQPMGRHPDPARRNELLDAVAEYLLEHGLADLSLRPLATAIETSPRMLLYHFGSKEQLVVAALARARERETELFSVWAGKMGAAEDPEQLVRRAWGWMSDPASEPFMRLFFEVYGMALQQPHRYPGFLDHAVEDWLGALTEGLKDAGLDHAEARNAATLVVAVARGLLLDLLATGDRERIDAAIDSLVGEAREHLTGAKV